MIPLQPVSPAKSIRGGVIDAGVPIVMISSLLALLVMANEGKNTPGSDSEDVTALLASAERVQLEDVAAWRNYRFQRSTLRDEADEDGRLKGTESLLFEVTPKGDGFDERLLRIDGRAPTSSEVDHFQAQAPFSGHYHIMVDEGGDEKARFSVTDFFRMSSYRYAGREEVEGVLCHRLDFTPRARADPAGATGKISRAMEGSLWLTVGGLHLARARAHVVEPVSLAMSLVKIHALEVQLEAGGVGEGVWLPKEIDLNSRVRVFFSTRQRRNVIRYSDFTALPKPAKASPAAR
jgi:hypothetical protein